MKRSYVKPVLNSSMEGTLEGVYAYGNVMAGTKFHGAGKQTNSKRTSKNEGGNNYCRCCVCGGAIRSRREADLHAFLHFLGF